ncbi:MAG: HAMP domain-containing histidine kinase [Chloroflexota bacterium]|nr:HAMP domain-containing histidine kinase [Chloroflexota bacterium]
MPSLDPRAWPIRWRLAALNVGVLAATLVLLGGVSLLQLDRALIGVTAEHLRDQAALAMRRPDDPRGRPAPDRGPGPRDRASDLNDRPPAPPGRGPGPVDRGGGPTQFALTLAATDLVRRLSGPDTGVLVFDTDGAPIAVSEWNEDVELWPRPTAEQLAAAARGGEITTTVDQETRRTLVLLLPMRAPDGTIVGVLELARSLELTDYLEARLRVILVVGALVALLVAGGLTLRATRSALRPLDQVILAARQIGAGKLDERLRLERRDEIGELAEAFDSMLDRLAVVLAAQRRFVADAAHELRTPLTALGGMVEMLEMGAHRGDPARIRHILDVMEREIGRLGRLVADLLTLSRLDAEQPLALGKVEVEPLVAEVVQQTRLLAQGQDVQLRVDATPTVRGDADRLKQVLINLAANALAFTPAGGQIEFRVDQVDGHARLAVADTGSGIAPELLPRVMERFARGDPSRSRGTGGAGLGLAIARDIVEAHGGTIELESEVGRGTTATVDLPLWPGRQDVATVKAAGDRSPRLSSRA